MSEYKVLGIILSDTGKYEVYKLRLDGKSIVLAGKANAGKTTILESLQLALVGGSRTEKQQQMVRRDAEAGTIDIVLQDENDENVNISIKMKAGKTPTMTAKVGGKSLNRADLNEMLQLINPDIMFLKRLPATGNNGKNQVETLLQMLGKAETYEKLKSRRQTAYEGRRDANRDVKKLEAQIKSEFDFEFRLQDVPKEKADPRKIMAELTQIRDADQTYQFLTREESAICQEIVALEERQKKVQVKLAEARKFIESLPSLEEKERELDKIEETNKLFEAAQKHKELEGIKKQVTLFQKSIEGADKMIHNLIADADLGVDGLSFDEDVGLTIHGDPLVAEGESMQLRTHARLWKALARKTNFLCAWMDGAESLGVEAAKELIKEFDDENYQLILTFLAEQPIEGFTFIEGEEDRVV